MKLQQAALNKSLTFSHLQMQRSSEECDGDQSLFTYLVLRLGRIILWWCTAEYLIHVMYMHCIQSNETYLEILPPWALGKSLNSVLYSIL